MKEDSPEFNLNARETKSAPLKKKEQNKKKTLVSRSVLYTGAGSGNSGSSAGEKHPLTQLRLRRMKSSE